MSDRVCIRGCVVKGVHYATCDDYGETAQRAQDAVRIGIAMCGGCAPRECREGSLICDKCFGRMRGLLDDAPDLLARLQSLADPRKATPTDQPHFGSTSVEPIAPVGADILDAIAVVEQVVVGINPADLPAISNDLDLVTWAAELVLERHRDVGGERAAWSVQDAVDRWGVERRDRNPHPWEDVVDDEELSAADVREWGDPIMSAHDIARRIGRTERTLRNWEKRELIRRVATTRERQRRTAWFRLSDVLAVWEGEEA